MGFNALTLCSSAKGRISTISVFIDYWTCMHYHCSQNFLSVMSVRIQGQRLFAPHPNLMQGGNGFCGRLAKLIGTNPLF